MREIKFRGKRKDNKEWVYGNYFITRYDNTVKIRQQLQDYSLYSHDVIVETVGQYTGLKDKNGKEIYEGDILKNEGKIGTVKYGKFNCSCCYGVYGWYIDTEYDYYLDIRDFEDDTVSIEVIGNIYDNPELLKKEG